jgi:serine/threonine protein phosphatase PrpC
MLHSHFEHGPHVVDVWEEPSLGVKRASQDASLVMPFFDGLGALGGIRLAALDGVSPHPDSDGALGVDAGVWASRLTRIALESHRLIDDALEDANVWLYDDTLNPWLRARTQVVACDLAGEDAYLVRAGDCQAYAKRAGVWEQVFADLVSPEEALRRNALYGHLSLDDLLRQAEDESQDSPSEWDPETPTQPLGQFEEPALERQTLAGVEELVLASDGARLTVPALLDLEGWLKELRSWEAVAPEAEPWKRHDDVVVVRWRRH